MTVTTQMMKSLAERVPELLAVFEQVATYADERAGLMQRVGELMKRSEDPEVREMLGDVIGHVLDEDIMRHLDLAADCRNIVAESKRDGKKLVK